MLKEGPQSGVPSAGGEAGQAIELSSHVPPGEVPAKNNRYFSSIFMPSLIRESSSEWVANFFPSPPHFFSGTVGAGESSWKK